MAAQGFKERIGAWLWRFQDTMSDKERQFAVLDTANRMQKGEGTLTAHEKPSAEVLSSVLELQYIISAHQNELAALLAVLIGPEYSDDLDEYIKPM